MGVNWWYASKNMEAVKREAAAKMAAAPAVAPPPANALPAEAAPARTNTPAASTTAPSATQEEKHELKVGSVTYQMTTRGGGIQRAVLLAHDQVDLNRHAVEPVGALRREASGTDQTPYRIISKDSKQVTFQGVTPDGIEVTKTYRVTEGKGSDEHLLALTLTLKNTGAAQHKFDEYYLYAGAAASLRPDEVIYPGFFWNNAGDEDHKDVTFFKGGMMSSEKGEFRGSYEKLRWGGVMDRFYAHIISTKENVDQPGKLWASRLQVSHKNDEFKDVAGADADYAAQGAVGLPVVDLAPGATQKLEYEIYLGPKEYHRLRDIGWQRSYVMFYGWFTVVSRVLTNIMRWMHDMTGSWGLAIILLTVVVRTCLWPVHAKSQNTMKRMALLGPKMKELQEKYKDDQQKISAETMKLYRDYGVNPLGGCLPMFIQIPIFFGFYRVLQYAAELRGQSFLWVQDLAAADTVYTWDAGFHIPLLGQHLHLNPLPLIMGVTMFLQMKLTPQPQTTDPMQKRIFMLMPFMFLFFCYSFAAALSLYWSTQNIFSIFQAWVTKLYQKDPVLEKVERVAAKPLPATASPFSNPSGKKKDNKDRNRPPRLGG
jgi:YidC/Oxa1 family membrane protein insertase